MNKIESFSLRKRLKSFIYAFNGIRNLIKREHNARIHIFALICVTGLGIFFRIGLTE